MKIIISNTKIVSADDGYIVRLRRVGDGIIVCKKHALRREEL